MHFATALSDFSDQISKYFIKTIILAIASCMLVQIFLFYLKKGE